jgi:hypothetical protein
MGPFGVASKRIRGVCDGVNDRLASPGKTGGCDGQGDSQHGLARTRPKDAPDSAERGEPAGPLGAFARRRLGWIARGHDPNRGEIERDADQPGDDACDEELADVGLGQVAVDDQEDARRDQDAERAINVALAAIGIDGPGWLTDPSLALYSVALVDLWKGVGLATLIYIAGLATISPDFYEAARIDGATRRQMFWPRAPAEG